VAMCDRFAAFVKLQLNQVILGFGIGLGSGLVFGKGLVLGLV